MTEACRKRMSEDDPGAGLAFFDFHVLYKNKIKNKVNDNEDILELHSGDDIVYAKRLQLLNWCPKEEMICDSAETGLLTNDLPVDTAKDTASNTPTRNEKQKMRSKQNHSRKRLERNLMPRFLNKYGEYIGVSDSGMFLFKNKNGDFEVKQSEFQNDMMTCATFYADCYLRMTSDEIARDCFLFGWLILWASQGLPFKEQI